MKTYRSVKCLGRGREIPMPSKRLVLSLVTTSLFVATASSSILDQFHYIVCNVMTKIAFVRGRRFIIVKSVSSSRRKLA